MDLILAFSLQDQVEKYGAYVGLAAFLGLAVLSLLYFAQARELKRLRDWAGRAPERAQELEARVVAQAEEALREPAAPAAPVAEPVAAPASGNGVIPMGPRPAVAVAALAAQAQAAPATVETPAVEEEKEAAAVAVGGGAPPETPPEPPAEPAAAEPEPEEPEPDEPDEAEEADAEPEPEPVQSGNGKPAEPPTQIPRATPRPQPRPAPEPTPEPAPVAAAPLRSSTPSRTIPPRRGEGREGGSRVALYTLIGVVVLAAAILVPVYFMVLAGDDDPEPQPNPIAEPSGTTTAGGAGGTAAAGTVEARSEKVVVVLNGTPVDGLASGERDKLIDAGYSEDQGMIRTANNADQQCQDSIVYYGDQERRQARDVARLLDITRTEAIDEETQALADGSDQTGSLPANVVALLCADKSP